jgi:hypothetical protein
MAIFVGSAHELAIKDTSIIDFYRETWGRPTILTQEDFYQWQFIAPPENAKFDYCCVALDTEQNVIAGVMGLNRRKFYVREEAILGAELTTWVVRQEYRNRGVAGKMLEFLQNEYDVMYGAGISSAALPIYLRYGFRYLKSLPRYVFVLDWDECEKYAEGAAIAKKISRSRRAEIAPVKYYLQEWSDDHYNIIREKNLAGVPHFSRESKDLQWRYSQHPFFHYRKFIVSSSLDSDGAFLSLRVSLSPDGLKVLHIVDLFGGASDMRSALEWVRTYAEKEGCHALDCYCTRSAVGASLMERGWFSILDDDYFVFPHLFYPIELRRPPSTSLIYWGKRVMPSLLDIGSVHVTKQDLDMDRPTPAILSL